MLLIDIRVQCLLFHIIATHFVYYSIRFDQLMDISNYTEHFKRVSVVLNRFDTQLLLKPCVVSLNRLSPKLVKKYDKPFFNRYYNHIYGNKFSTIITSPKNEKTCNESKTSLWCNGRNNNSLDFYRQFESRLSQPSNPHINHDEPEPSDTNIYQNLRYLGLIKTAELANRPPKELNRFFPVRHISRCDFTYGNKTDSKAVNKKIIINDVIRNYTINKFRRDKYKERKPKKKRFCYDERIKRKYKLMVENKRQRNKLNELSERETKEYMTKILQNEVLKYVSKTSFSSPLGQQINDAITHSDNYDDVKCCELKLSSLESYEPFCSTNIRFVNKCHHRNVWNEWKCSTIENMCFKSDMTANNSLKYAHKYSFNRTQRLEKLVRFKTGLNWRSRLLSVQCKPLKLKPIKRSKCVLCDQQFIGEHICQTNCLKLSDFTVKHQLENNSSLNSVNVNNNFSNLDKNEEQLKNIALGNVYNAMIEVNKLNINSLIKTCHIELNIENDAINRLYS